MSRPLNKEELVHLSDKKYTELLTLIDSYSQDQQLRAFNGTSLNRNIRDVLGHLHHWHLMMLGWYEIGMSHKKPDMPAKGYTWKDLPTLNQKINQEYLTKTLQEVRALFESSHKSVQSMIVNHSDEELFTKKYFDWTGKTSLGAYLVSCTSSHYDWAIKFVKKGLK